MDVYKEYLYEISKVEYQEPYLMLIWDYSPPIYKTCIPLILNIPFEEHNHNVYYGAIKKVCHGFVFFYSNCMYSSRTHCERFSNVLSYTEMLELFNNTVNILNTNHTEVLKDFEPITSEREQKQLDEIKTLHTNYMAEMDKLGKLLITYDKENMIHDFAKDHFKICVERTYQIGEFTREFLAQLIAGRLSKIRVSLEDILQRLQKNSILFHGKYETKLNGLFEEMYFYNKEKLKNSRRMKSNLTETVEIERKIDTVRRKIEQFGNYETVNRLKSEIAYWTREKRAFEEIASSITKIKKVLDRAKEQAKTHSKYKSTDLPGRRVMCWDLLGENFKEMAEDLEKKYVEACRPLITFFVCTGIDRISYYDDIGAYFIDEFGHPNYFSHSGTKIYHVNCDGTFKENLENDKYYFDKCGRYIIENGEKVHQLAPCTSKFKSSNQGLFEKLSPCACSHECGLIHEACHANLREVGDVLILPKSTPVDIKNTLDAETTKYLWDAFAYILPEVLTEVGESQPMNPIIQIAHSMVHKKYSLTPNETRAKKAQLEEYRKNVIKRHNEKVTASILEWKSKLGKPGKPEHLDNLAQQVYAQHEADQEQFVRDIEGYCYHVDVPWRVPAIEEVLTVTPPPEAANVTK